MEPTTDPTEPTEHSDVDHGDLLASDQPERHSRSRRGVVGALLTVALLAAGATGVALASTSGTATPTPGSTGSPSASPEGGQRGPFGDHDGRRGPGARGFGGLGMFGLMGAVHGEVVVPKQGGGYQTLLMQRGTATAVSSGSISVKSADGFTATYDVTANTQVNAGSAGITSIDKNASVVVTARKTASGGTALRVLDLSQLGQLHRDFDGDGRRGPDRRGPGAPGGTATPSPTASTGGTSFGV